MMEHVQTGMTRGEFKASRRRWLTGVWIGVGLFLFGCIFGGVGLGMFMAAPDTDSTTQGVLVDVRSSDSSCGATARFEVDGTTYSATTNVDSSGMCDNLEGTPIEVRYASDDPTVNEIGMRQSTFGLIFLGVGAPFMLAGLITAIVSFVRRSRVERVPDSRPSATPSATPGAAPDVEAMAPPVAPADGDDAGLRAGWYPTEDGLHERWHNGMGWSDTTRPRVSAD